MNSDPQAAPLSTSPMFEAAHPWVRRLTRLGFVARGTLYSLIGALTLWSVAHAGERAHGGMKTTFNWLHSVAPGVLLLGALALGFAAFAIGMIWTAVFDWNFEGKSTLGITRRAGAFIAGLVHVSLAATTGLLIAGHQSQDHATRRWTELAMGVPFGRVGVAIGGLYAVGFGIFLLSKIVTGKLDKLLDLSSLHPIARHCASWIGRIGEFARGVIYITMGVVLAFAGLRNDASNVVGLGGAMRAASDEAFGTAALATIAAGLVAYGLFMFLEARYRRIGERE